MKLSPKLQLLLDAKIPAEKQSAFIENTLEAALNSLPVSQPQQSDLFSTAVSDLQIYTDGGARGNPGTAGCGVIICDSQGDELLEKHQAIGIATNNQAEYKAVLLAYKVLRQHFQAQAITFYSDSELLVKQLRGEYKVKNPDLKLLYEQIKQYESQYTNVRYNHVPRAKNKRADELANMAMDGI